jgi:hypothetical protein
MIYILIVSTVFLAGCYSLGYVDPKGRDCTENFLIFAKWSSCNKFQEPLATTRQEVKLDVKQSATNSEK